MKKKRRSDIDFEIAFYEGILGFYENYTDVLAVIGHLYTERGFFDKGLAVDLRLSRLHPNEPLVHYNLACSYALTAQTDLAFEALNRAVDLGYDAWQHMEDDRDLNAIREDPRYLELLQRMRQPPDNSHRM